MKSFRIALMGVLLALIASQGIAGEKILPGEPAVSVHPKVESVYARLLQAHLRAPRDRSGFEAFAKANGIPAKGFSVEIEIHVYPPADTGMVDRAALERFGFQARATSENFMEGHAPIQNVFAIADASPAIGFVRRVTRPIPKVTSEGVMLTGASAWQSGGANGSGVRIAIIDGGFSGVSSAVSNGEFGSYTSQDFSGGGFPGNSVHGMGCAEIVYDFAPAATYWLIRVASVTDIQNAVTYCINNNVDIVSFSLGFDNSNYSDGLGTLCTTVNNAYSNGIVWCGAAGNEGQDQYWVGSWADADTDNYIEFSGSDETQNVSCSAGSWIVISLTWDTSNANSS
ncbi:MAG: S8 family serine peptidase, partial [Planctomycetota bacterium]